MIARPPLVVILSILAVGTALATDFGDCASAARKLKSAADHAESAQSNLEFAKSSYESACGPYGYSRDNESACGRFGYLRSPLESAKADLDSAARDVEHYASRIANACDASISSVRSTLFKQVISLQHELSAVKQELTNCKNNPGKKAD